MRQSVLLFLLVTLGIICRIHCYPNPGGSRPPPPGPRPPPPGPGPQRQGMSRPRPPFPPPPPDSRPQPPRQGPGPGPGPGQFDGDETGTSYDYGDQWDYSQGNTGVGDYSDEYVPTDDLHGDEESVCSIEVQQTVHTTPMVNYLCWYEDEVPCYMCGAMCRMYGNMCFKQTRRSCPQQESRFTPQVVERNYCCPGYEQLGDTCEQIATSPSACGSNRGGCEQLCVNGMCECLDGFRLVDGTRCEDINECASANGGCNQGCFNTPGSFVCTCTDGYRLVSPLTCQEVDECSVNNGGCAHMCQNTRGSFYCQCDAGFMRVRDFECHAIDQCMLYNPCSHTCVSLPGTYVCRCPPGMQLDGPYGRNCVGEAVLSKGADGTKNNRPRPDDISVNDKNTGSSAAEKPPPAKSKSSPSIALIVGAVLGGLFLIFCITLTVCVTKRLQNSSSSTPAQATGASSGPSSAPNRDNDSHYQPNVHHHRHDTRPPKYDNNAYDGLIPSSMPKGLAPPPMPSGGPMENDYIEVLPPPPPYSVAPPVPKEAYMIPTSGSPPTDGPAIYEVLTDYGAAAPMYDNPNGNPRSPRNDRPPPPLPRSPRPSGNRTVPTAPEQEKGAVPPLNDHQLTAARDKLKKHSKN